MTESQRAMRRAILAALKEVKKQAQASWHTANKDEFVAHFHLSCIKNSETLLQGQRCHVSQDDPIYAYGRSALPPSERGVDK